METDKKNFLGIKNCSYDKTKISVIQAPLEKTTSYNKGTILGPKAILEASLNLEEYDIETDLFISDKGIYNLLIQNLENISLDKALLEVENTVALEIQYNHFPLVLGGEHSLSFGVYKGLLKKYPDVGVIQFDAHADLRESYEFEKLSHACVMKRIREYTKNTCGIGIRSYSQEEADYIKENNVKIILADAFFKNNQPVNTLIENLKKMPKNIFITFDIDVFDPSVIPSTGTPEPGGLDWYQCINMLKIIFKEKNVVAADIVELMPGNSKVSDFIAAKLALKMIAYYTFFSKVKKQ